MPFEEYKQPPITGARGPGSPFEPNQIVNVPGIGPVRLSDYGPSVRGIDIPVTSSREMRGNAVNRVVNINGRNVQLSGYMPSNYDPKNQDPTGGGSLDAYGHRIVPYTNQAPSPGAVSDDPFAGGYPTSAPDNVQQMRPPDLPPLDQYGMGNPPTTAPFQGAPANVPTNELVAPDIPNQFLQSNAGANIPTGENMIPMGSDQFLPYQYLDIPTNEWSAPTPTNQYSGDAPVNVPTPEGMLPTGPNDFLPSAGANIPTNESMAPTDPQQYLGSTAGANIPTDESMVPTGPNEFLPSEAAATPAAPPKVSYYPDGQGGYTPLDEAGNPVGSSTPGLGDRPGQLYSDTSAPDLGGWGQPMGYFAPGTSGPGPLSNLNPGGITWSDVAASGITPSTGPYQSQGGVPAPGGWGGTYGQGSAGYLPWDYYGSMSRARMIHGGDPTLGVGMTNTAPGDPIAQFAAGGTGFGGKNLMGGFGIRGQGANRYATSYVNPKFFAPPARVEPSSRKPGGGAAAGGIGGGGPGGIP